MSELEWKPGDPCPNCGGPVPQIPLPTDAMRAAAANIADYVPISQRFDTATPAQIAKEGRLYRCAPCWSQFRVKDAAPAAGSSHE